MKIAVPSRHGRLFALCGLSAALHLLCLDLVARHTPAEPPRMPGADSPLVLRLAPARASAAPAPAATQAPPSSAGPDGAMQPAPAAIRAAERAPDRPAPPSAPAPAADGKTAAPTTAPAPDLAPVAPAQAAAATSASAAVTPPVAEAGGAPSPGNAEVRTLLHYRVRLPPPVRLDYALTRRDAAGHAAPVQPAWLEWRNDDERYRLDMDGVLGRLSSSGVSGDEGIQPQRFAERRGGRDQEGGIDPATHRVLFADGAAAPDAPGIQDRGSLLMQLAGIGLARAAQVDGEIEVVVAGDGQARVERFQVMGLEPVDSGAGRLMAWRLAQKVAVGAARLEVWLAPDQGWLPVQLRVTEADGASATQVLARAPAAPAP